MLCEIYLARLEDKYVFSIDLLMASHRLYACTGTVPHVLAGAIGPR